MESAHIHVRRMVTESFSKTNISREIMSFAQSVSHLLFFAFPENFNIAGNGSVPLRSMGIQSQSLYRGPLHCISTVLQNEGIQGLYRGAGAMILRDVPGYTLYFIPYMLFCNWLNPDGNATPHPCCIWLAGGLAGKWDMGPIPELEPNKWLI